MGWLQIRRIHYHLVLAKFWVRVNIRGKFLVYVYDDMEHEKLQLNRLFS